MRNTIHFIIAVLLWIVFVYYWQLVMQRPMNPDTRAALIALGVLSLFSIVYLTGWVFYNIRIARKFQRRKVRQSYTVQPVQDFMGRWIVADRPEILRAANNIEIVIKSSVVQDKTIEEKIFRVGPAGSHDD
ncbi:MAG: hypothetical protein OEN01_09205 [Candidatus Krumholzibacteria bacterium]|nr:hypothetical protein [Candidatus Krumholzibacteria bacterium]